MSFTDPIADMITRIRNAQLRTLNKVSIPNSKFGGPPIGISLVNPSTIRNLEDFL